MHTSIGIFALANLLLAPAPAPSGVVLWRDYQVAQEKGVKESKPLAVFVGTGQRGYRDLTQEGRWNDTINKVLAESYVCVYLDAADPSSEDLIKDLAITRGHGLVLSDRTGSKQAFHHDGQISETDLAENLRHFGTDDVTVRATISNADRRVSYYPESASRQTGAVAVSRTRNC